MSGFDIKLVGGLLSPAVDLATVLGTLLALIALVVEVRRERMARAVSDLQRLVETWDSLEMRVRRSLAARRVSADSRQREELFPEAIHILNVFEYLGQLLRRGGLKVSDLSAALSTAALVWWYALRPGIAAVRYSDVTIYEEYERLVSRLLKLESIELREEDLEREDFWRALLKEEEGLLDDARAILNALQPSAPTGSLLARLLGLFKGP